MKTNQQIAKELEEVYYSHKTCNPIAEEMENKSMEEAYAIQEINTEKWIAEGRKVVGCKIGLTAPAVQKQLGVDQPDFGILYSDMAYENEEEVEMSRLIQPKVEAEIAIILKKDLKLEKHTVEDVLEASDYALPAIEIVDSRDSNWKITIFDTIADNASSALFAFGDKPVRMQKVDWENCQMQMYNHEQLVSKGEGKDCMGNPLNAAAWLADKMVEQNRPLKAGDIILTGALGPMFNISGGEKITAKISTVGSLTISFNKKESNE